MNIKLNHLEEFRDEQGRLYVECRADALNPFFIDITTCRVETEWQRRRYSICLDEYKLPKIVINAAHEYLKFKLKKVCPRILPSFDRYTISSFPLFLIFFSPLSQAILKKQLTFSNHSCHYKQQQSLSIVVYSGH